jgi:RHS repeat-associated protein
MDEYMNFDVNEDPAGWQLVPASAYMNKQKLQLTDINIKKPGYLFVYLTYENESNNWVFFDDLKVSYTPGNIIQQNDYYPFGLAMSTSWTRETAVNNNYLYNAGSELNDNTQWYEMFFRGYDPALGRMLQIDPVASKYSSLTPYNYAFNDPVAFNDPSGADPFNPYGDALYYGILISNGGSIGAYQQRNSEIMDPGGRHSGGGAIRMNGNSIVINWNNTGNYGGTWSPGGRFRRFTSDEQAFIHGSAYVSRHGAWEHTEYKSYAYSEFAFIWAKATGELPTFEAVHYHLSRTSNLLASTNVNPLLSSPSGIDNSLVNMMWKIMLNPELAEVVFEQMTIFKVLHSALDSFGWDWFLETTHLSNKVSIQTAVIITYNTSKKDLWGPEYGKVTDLIAKTRRVFMDDRGNFIKKDLKLYLSPLMKEWIQGAIDYHCGGCQTSQTLLNKYWEWLKNPTGAPKKKGPFD